MLGPIVCYIGAIGCQPTGLTQCQRLKGEELGPIVCYIGAVGWQPTGLTQCQRLKGEELGPIVCYIGAVGRQPTGLAGTDFLLYWGCRLATYRAYTVSKGRSWYKLSAILGL